MTKRKEEIGKGTITELWDFAMRQAARAAEEAAERFQLPYSAAFDLLKYLERYSWNMVMNMPHNKGWMTRHFQGVLVEADRIAYMMARFLRTADEKERRELAARLDEELGRK